MHYLKAKKKNALHAQHDTTHKRQNKQTQEIKTSFSPPPVLIKKAKMTNNPTTKEPVEQIVVVVEKEPEAKKQKTTMTTETMKKESTTTPESPEDEWPEAWYMLQDGDYEDQKAENRMSPNNKPCSVAELKKLGIAYWKMDAETYTYPVKAIPWDPKDAADPKLMAIRDDRGYSYADIISVKPDLLPGYDEKIKAFFEEHIHDAEEIRYIIDGSGYFDIRDTQNNWIRIHIKKGDLMTLPEGCYHRFTCDTTDFIQAMRLFIGAPVWTPFNRPQEQHPSRIDYVTNYMDTNVTTTA